MDKNLKLGSGKLDNELLKKIIFNNIKYHSSEVLVRAGVGEDCAVVDFHDYECILSTDPITAAVSEIGRLAVHVTCNDIASNGLKPLGILLAVMLPVGTTIEEIEEIMEQAGSAASEMEVEIIGGHTEITPAVNQPVIVSTAVGKGKKNQSPSIKNIAEGDLIFMTKYAGMEGTGIIASDLREQLKGVCSNQELESAADLLKNVSVVKEGIRAGKVGVSAMHDITEGGVLGAVWEMCDASDMGCELWIDRVPVMEVTEKICNFFRIDYLRLISSGCMLIIAPPTKKKELEEAMGVTDVKLSQIGEIKSKEYGMIKRRGIGENMEKTDIAPPASDEIYKVIF